MGIVPYFLPDRTMMKNTTVMVWYIALLMTLGAWLGHSPSGSEFTDFGANAFGARNIRMVVPNDYSGTPTSARIILNGIEYEAALSRIPSYTY